MNQVKPYLFWIVVGSILLIELAVWVLGLSAVDAVGSMAAAETTKNALDSEYKNLAELEKRARNGSPGLVDAENKADLDRITTDYLITEPWKSVLEPHVRKFADQAVAIREYLVKRSGALHKPVKDTLDRFEWYQEYEIQSKKVLETLYDNGILVLPESARSAKPTGTGSPAQTTPTGIPPGLRGGMPPGMMGGMPPGMMGGMPPGMMGGMPPGMMGGMPPGMRPGTIPTGATKTTKKPADGEVQSEGPDFAGDKSIRDLVGLYTKGAELPDSTEHAGITLRLRILEQITRTLIKVKSANSINPSLAKEVTSSGQTSQAVEPGSPVPPVLTALTWQNQIGVPVTGFTGAAEDGESAAAAPPENATTGGMPPGMMGGMPPGMMGGMPPGMMGGMPPGMMGGMPPGLTGGSSASTKSVKSIELKSDATSPVKAHRISITLEGSISSVLAGQAALEGTSGEDDTITVVTSSRLDRKANLLPGDRKDVANEPVILVLELCLLDFAKAKVDTNAIDGGVGGLSSPGAQKKPSGPTGFPGMMGPPGGFPGMMGPPGGFPGMMGPPKTTKKSE